jgi:drug/metabolite transporter (DMT)-like permease
MIFAPVFRWLIETRGWPQAFTLIAIIVGVILISARSRAHRPSAASLPP